MFLKYPLSSLEASPIAVLVIVGHAVGECLNVAILSIQTLPASTDRNHLAPGEVTQVSMANPQHINRIFMWCSALDVLECQYRIV
ncbi:hypothetical protein, partial [Yersinia pekkanenii]|uniref:hypothetical protein n=1 Tax=Yersinia pekkanenii TaxID=1288385 RepID=UPI001ADF9E7E